MTMPAGIAAIAASPLAMGSPDTISQLSKAAHRPIAINRAPPCESAWVRSLPLAISSVSSLLSAIIVVNSYFLIVRWVMLIKDAEISVNTSNQHKRVLSFWESI